jgi:tetratricopeptide (TPR) repeat protein
VESAERMMREIGEEHAAEAEGGGKWQLGVALGAACHVAGGRYNRQKMWDKGKAAYERALRLRLDALGEQHPATAATLASLGVTYSYMGNRGLAIMLYERALRIYKDTLGPHPATATTMSNMGTAYDAKGQSKEAIELFQQALRIYESTVGRMHPDAARAIYSMGSAYYNLGDFARAEELGLEAARIYTLTLGPDHEETKDARDGLAAISKAKPFLKAKLFLREKNGSLVTENTKGDDREAQVPSDQPLNVAPSSAPALEPAHFRVADSPVFENSIPYHSMSALDLATMIGRIGSAYQCYEEEFTSNDFDGRLLQEYACQPAAQLFFALSEMNVRKELHRRRIHAELTKLWAPLKSTPLPQLVN